MALNVFPHELAEHLRGGLILLAAHLQELLAQIALYSDAELSLPSIPTTAVTVPALDESQISVANGRLGILHIAAKSRPTANGVAGPELQSFRCGRRGTTNNAVRDFCDIGSPFAAPDRSHRSATKLYGPVTSGKEAPISGYPNIQKILLVQ